MAEWSNALVLKTSVPRGTGGSNPSLSAKTPENQRFTLVFFLCPYANEARFSEREGYKKIQNAKGGLVFKCFWYGSPSRDLLSEAKKIPATKATGIKFILGCSPSNTKMYHYKNSLYNLNYGSF